MSTSFSSFLSSLRAIICPARLLFLLACVALLLVQLARADTAIRGDVDAAAVSNTVPVWYFTLRNHTGKQKVDDYYGNERSTARTGVCEVQDKYPTLNKYATRLPFHIPDIDKEVHRLTEFPQQGLWNELQKAARSSPRNNIVLYVHGYNISFDKACRRAATFQKVIGDHTRLLLFSWPSNGELVSYTHDEADVEWSQHYLISVIRQLVQIYGTERVDIVAHSLGSRGVFRALQLMAQQKTSPLINELILLAPDIDSAVFSNAWPQMRHITRRITLYTAQNDKPLMLSREVHGYPRLGEAGEDMVLLDGIETIDVTNSGGKSLSGHLYHLHNDAVRADLCRLLSTGKPAALRPRLQPRERGSLTFWELQPLPATES